MGHTPSTAGDEDFLTGYQVEPHKEAMMSPRRYYKGESISAAWQRVQQKNPEKEYEGTCQKLKSKPNSHVCSLLKEDFNHFANEEVLDFSDNFLGEKGFIALLPLINSNTKFSTLNAAANGLRNEAVSHLVDMLLRPKHADRQISLNLSRNPISATGFQALAVLAARHPTVMEIDVSRTQIPRRKIIQLREFMQAKRLDADKERAAAEEVEEALAPVASVAEGSAAAEESLEELGVAESEKLPQDGAAEREEEKPDAAQAVAEEEVGEPLPVRSEG